VRKLVLAGALLVVVVVVVGVGGCGRPKSRCERTCARTVECARELKLVEGLDLSECVDECSKLDREANMQHFVAEHVKCVDGAGESCETVLRCP